MDPCAFVFLPVFIGNIGEKKHRLNLDLTPTTSRKRNGQLYYRLHVNELAKARRTARNTWSVLP